MATYWIKPAPPVRADGPYVKINLPTNVGDNTIKILAGSVRGVRQYWALQEANLRLVADANAANRRIKIYKYTDSITNQASWCFKGQEVAATEDKSLQVAGAQYFHNAGEDTYDIIGIANESLVICGENYLALYIASAQVGDVMSGNITLKYLNWSWGLPSIEPKLI